MQLPPLAGTSVAITAAEGSPGGEPEVLIAHNDVAVVVQGGGEPHEAISAALDEAGMEPDALPPDIAVVEVPPPAGADDGERMFIVLWGRVARSLHWLDEGGADGVPIAEADGLRPELMAGVLAAGNMALGAPDGGADGAYPTLTRWLAVASPSRAAWDALDRFFLARKNSS